MKDGLITILILTISFLLLSAIHTTEAQTINIKPFELIEVKGEVREITAYNAGDINQCDSSPCISASGDNICELLEKGIKVCAANFVPLRTTIYIEGFGECLVLDRLASRHRERVDIAFPYGDLKAKEWGIKLLRVI